jgi:hypothetical protein
MSKNNKQLIVLVVLLVTAGLVYLWSRNGVPSFEGVSQADTSHFTPLDVQAPDLRLDLLAKIHNEEYTGSNRDIFSSSSPPPAANDPGKPSDPNKIHPNRRPPGDPFPMQQPPVVLPPVQFPGQFFGFETRHSGAKVAFFLQGEDVVVVAQGDAFMGNWRLIHIGNESAELEEMSTGRRTTVPLEQNPDLAANPGNPQQ